MFAQESFFESWTFIGIMALLLIGLLGVFFYLRNQKAEDD